jgi:hypothetical protein
VFFMDMFLKHVKAQWHMYLIILFLLTVLGFERSGKGVGATAGVAADSASAARAAPAGEEKNGETRKESPSLAVAVDASSQCAGGCPGKCATGKRGSPFRATQWRFDPDVGLYHLRVQSGWLLSVTEPGSGAKIVYVPMIPKLGNFRRKFHQGGVEPGYERFRFGKPGCGASPDRSLLPRGKPIPGYLSPFTFDDKSGGAAKPDGGAEKQPEKEDAAPDAPVIPGSAGSEEGAELRLPDSGLIEEEAGDDEADGFMPGNIAGLGEEDAETPAVRVIEPLPGGGGEAGACGR